VGGWNAWEKNSPDLGRGGHAERGGRDSALNEAERKRGKRKIGDSKSRKDGAREKGKAKGGENPPQKGEFP